MSEKKLVRRYEIAGLNAPRDVIDGIYFEIVEDDVVVWKSDPFRFNPLLVLAARVEVMRNEVANALRDNGMPHDLGVAWSAWGEPPAAVVKLASETAAEPVSFYERTLNALTAVAADLKSVPEVDGFAVEMLWRLPAGSSIPDFMVFPVHIPFNNPDDLLRLRQVLLKGEQFCAKGAEEGVAAMRKFIDQLAATARASLDQTQPTG